MQATKRKVSCSGKAWPLHGFGGVGEEVGISVPGTGKGEGGEARTQ